MRILQLCKKFPWPLKDGEAIAVTYLAKAYRDLGHEVTLVAMNTSKHWLDINTLPDHYDHYTNVETVNIDNRILPIPALLNLFSSQSYHIARFMSADFSAKLIEVLDREPFDVVQLESIYLSPYIPIIRQHCKGKVVLRAHNVEHEIWERVAIQSNPLKKWYLNTITPRLKLFETQCLNDHDLIMSMSERDAQQFTAMGFSKPAIVVPIGIDSRDYHPDFDCFSKPLSLSFIGSLDWMPNQDGLRWFLDEIWKPLLLPAFPDLTFHIAGRTAPDWIRNLKVERVVFHGEVPDAGDFLNQHAIMVVPLLSGGGMRAKIIEGLALGRVVLSTQVGMEGIPAVSHQSCLLAKTPQEWLETIQGAQKHKASLAAIGNAGLQLCLEHFDNKKIAENALMAFKTVMTKGV